MMVIDMLEVTQKKIVELAQRLTLLHCSKDETTTACFLVEWLRVLRHATTSKTLSY